MTNSPIAVTPPHAFWDRVGMWLSYICALHCALMPLVIGYLALSGMGKFAAESTEWAIIGCSLGIGLFRLFYSYFHEHRQAAPIFFFLIGVSLILIAKSVFFVTPDSMEPVGMVAGGLLIGTAHFRNLAKSKCCQQSLVGARLNG